MRFNAICPSSLKPSTHLLLYREVVQQTNKQTNKLHGLSPRASPLISYLCLLSVRPSSVSTAQFYKSECKAEYRGDQELICYIKTHTDDPQ
jgi:hypothetical protein